MIAGSTRGDISFYRTIFELASDYIGGGSSQIFSIILLILGLMAAGGGFTVLIGTAVIASDHRLTGKVVVALGAGMGIIGFSIFMIKGILTGTLVEDFLSILGPGFLGIILTIIARLKL